MPVTKVLSRKLKDSLGPDTGEELVAWMEHTDTQSGEASVLRTEVQDFRGEMLGFRRDMNEFRSDMQRDMKEFRSDMQRDMKEMRLSLEARMDIGFATTEAKFERRIGDLMKWSFVFWCGAVAAIAALAGVLK